MKERIKVKISKRKTINTLLKTTASCIDSKYYFLPYWFEKDTDGNFIMHHLEHLSNDLKGRIIKQRKNDE